jgi:hypothetical protein
MLEEVQEIIEELEEEGYKIKVWKDSEGNINWVSNCKCSGYTEGKDYRTFRCREHLYIPEFEEDDIEEEYD